MAWLGVLALDEAFAAIDFDTFALLFGMMIVVANLIIAQRTLGAGVTISFWAYFKVGALLTVATILFGIWWL